MKIFYERRFLLLFIFFTFIGPSSAAYATEDLKKLSAEAIQMLVEMDARHKAIQEKSDSIEGRLNEIRETLEVVERLVANVDCESNSKAVGLVGLELEDAVTHASVAPSLEAKTAVEDLKQVLAALISNGAACSLIEQ